MPSSSFEPLPPYFTDTTSSIELEDQTNLLPKFPGVLHVGLARKPELTWLGCCLQYDRLLVSFLRPRSRRNSIAKKRKQIYRRALRTALLLIGTFVFVSALEALFYPSYQKLPGHYQELRHTIRSSAQSGRGNPNEGKIFIAANIVNEKLIRGAWGDALLELVDILGEDNVFISIYENDSGTGTRDALYDLQSKLPCNSSVVAGDHLSLDQFPKITTPAGEQRTKRIAYLAEVRNRALRPLDHTYIPPDNETGFRHTDMTFDRVLYLNDIFFSAVDAAQLLFSTNKGKYRAACAIDFVSNVMFYDSFVVRDTEGYGMGLTSFPWFAPTGSAQSRNAVLAGKDAVPVRSCWGGMASFNAELFQGTRSSNSSAPMLRFRHEPEPFWEAAECCLVFADMEESFGEPDVARGTGVFVNPFIRVAYTQHTWDWLPFFRRYERIFRNLQYIVSKIGYPEYNPRRLDRPGQLVKHNVWNNREAAGPGMGGSFQTVERAAAPGGFCGQRRMFLMKRDLASANRRGEKNWEKVFVP